MLVRIAEAIGAVGASAVGIIAAGESMPITVTAIGAVLGFATLLVRSVTANQRVYVEIVAAKDREIADRDDTIHYLRWENESIRFRHHEREVDPGPYIPRRPPYIPPPAPTPAPRTPA